MTTKQLNAINYNITKNRLNKNVEFMNEYNLWSEFNANKKQYNKYGYKIALTRFVNKKRKELI